MLPEDSPAKLSTVCYRKYLFLHLLEQKRKTDRTNSSISLVCLSDAELLSLQTGVWLQEPRLFTLNLTRSKCLSVRQHSARPTVFYQASPLLVLPHLEKPSTGDSNPTFNMQGETEAPPQLKSKLDGINVVCWILSSKRNQHKTAQKMRSQTSISLVPKEKKKVHFWENSFSTF